ncbi:hypothetical protein E2C01_041500 [Portunus trituberculatus]|uniref:Uncharacterized protein n=1 Tax=Portunus trituberculatus TaxID=210409 RepID=A0A5B7FTR0_PORTR|nr:hypothetical protein [Portunus trituberculatus]
MAHRVSPPVRAVFFILVPDSGYLWETRPADHVTWKSLFLLHSLASVPLSFVALISLLTPHSLHLSPHANTEAGMS